MIRRLCLQFMIFFPVGILLVVLLIGTIVLTGCEGLQQNYVNYTSYKFKIQFQYPYKWIQSEKFTDKEVGSDIWVTNYSNKSSAVFWITAGNDTHLGSDLQTGIKNLNFTLMKKYANNSYRTIEPSAISTIDGKIAATSMHSFVESLDGVKIDEVQQIWLVYVGSRDYYLIGFKAPSHLFAGVENSQARNDFIKSVRFLERK